MKDGDCVPDVFLLLFDYFQANSEEYMKLEGIFRINGDEEEIIKIHEELKEGCYEYLSNCEFPLTVAVFLKRVFKLMGEPLCTFDLYQEYRDVNSKYKCIQ